MKKLKKNNKNISGNSVEAFEMRSNSGCWCRCWCNCNTSQLHSDTYTTVYHKTLISGNA